MAQLYGIDVSSNQPANICSKVKYDFAIVKMSGNPHGYTWNYVNPSAKQQINDAYKKTGLVGLYHFTYGLNDANTEADFFVGEVKKLGYLNKAILVVDYEAEALKKGRTWVKKFCDRVKEKAGYAPVLYSSSSVIAQQKLNTLNYPIWCANYTKGYTKIYGYNTAGCKLGYSKAKIWQFTSQCILNGYSAGLDANVFYGTKEEWKALAGIKNTTQTVISTPKPKTPAITKIKVDGKWSKSTTTALQKLLKTTVDGIISNQRAVNKKYLINCTSDSWKFSTKGNSECIKALQKKLKVNTDGIAGPQTIKALQKYLKVTVDGYCGPITVKALQNKINTGKL